MKLRQLVLGIEGIEVRGSKEVDITGIASDSRIVAPGNLFIAKKGLRSDGASFIHQAVNSGAKAVVTDLYDPFLGLPQIIHPFPSRLEALLSSKYYGRPSQKLFVVGVTGSKGKTTTTYLCRHLIESFGEKCGLLGTIETIIGDERLYSECTTRDAMTNQKLLKEMLVRKCSSAVLEVSSHGLCQDRVSEIAFDVGIFTNLYPDHLDYHKTMDQYAEAKKKLFSQVDGVSIVNQDSPYSSFMRGKGNILTVGIENRADIRASDIVFHDGGTQFVIDGVRFESPLLGLFNVYNILSAIALGISQGKNLKQMSSLFLQFAGVPGRLQRVPNEKGIHVIVDYAHTEESLDHVLFTLKKVAKQKMIVVFGCGGERDSARRKGMARSAEKYADFSIITTDNPRSEDPQMIAQEILKGFQESKNVTLILDRKEAISSAINMAHRGDFVVIAGKGHEKVQIFLNKTVTFDDVDVAIEVLRA